MENNYYIPELGIDGTAEQLIDWSYRYSEDYSEEALEKIAEIARGEKRKDSKIPLLVIQDRRRKSGAPYEIMKIDHYLGRKISYSKTMEYGELEIREEGGKVLIAVYGTDSEGQFTAVAAFDLGEFLNGDQDWLEIAIGSILYHCKEYEEGEE